VASPAKPVLSPDKSAALRDRLVAELDGLQSADEAANWAHRRLPAKNTLTAADAELVEAGFRLKLAVFADSGAANGLPEPIHGSPREPAGPPRANAQPPSADATGAASPSGIPPAGKTIRLR
jgi:hypothetical protein